MKYRVEWTDRGTTKPEHSDWDNYADAALMCEWIILSGTPKEYVSIIELDTHDLLQREFDL